MSVFFVFLHIPQLSQTLVSIDACKNFSIKAQKDFSQYNFKINFGFALRHA